MIWDYGRKLDVCNKTEDKIDRKRKKKGVKFLIELVFLVYENEHKSSVTVL